ncbi:MAG: hypothetical protein HQ518_08655 [Rhodopirellula sp.]|nr:hypothetical protein [Rhodopirellula sp.]
MTINRSALTDDGTHPDAEYINTFFNAAQFSITVVRRFLVFANAPAIGFEEAATVEAIREDLKAGPVLASSSPIQYLLRPLQECVTHGLQTLDQLPRELADRLSSQLAEEIDPWSNNCHEAAIRIAKSLYDGIRLIEPWDNLFTDPAVFFERELAITWFVEHEWQFRAMRVPKLEKRVIDEHLALLRYVNETTKGSQADDSKKLMNPQQLHLHDSQQNTTRPQNRASDTVPSSIDKMLQQFASLVPEGVTVMRVASILSTGAKSANDRMCEACELLPELYRWNSTEWADALQVTNAAIRKTDFWKRIRPEAIAIAEAEERRRRDDYD